MKITYQQKRQLLELFYDEINKKIVPEGCTDYIELKLNQYNSPFFDEPGVQIYPALVEMLNKKVNQNSIIDLVRVVQLEMIEHFLFTLGGEFIEGGNNWTMSIRDLKTDKEYKIESGELYDYFDMSQFVIKSEETKDKIKRRAKKELAR